MPVPRATCRCWSSVRTQTVRGHLWRKSDTWAPCESLSGVETHRVKGELKTARADATVLSLLQATQTLSRPGSLLGPAAPCSSAALTPERQLAASAGLNHCSALRSPMATVFGKSANTRWGNIKNTRDIGGHPNKWPVRKGLEAHNCESSRFLESWRGVWRHSRK